MIDADIELLNNDNIKKIIIEEASITNYTDMTNLFYAISNNNSLISMSIFPESEPKTNFIRGLLNAIKANKNILHLKYPKAPREFIDAIIENQVAAIKLVNKIISNTLLEEDLPTLKSRTEAIIDIISTGLDCEAYEFDDEFLIRVIDINYVKAQNPPITKNLPTISTSLFSGRATTLIDQTNYPNCDEPIIATPNTAIVTLTFNNPQTNAERLSKQQREDRAAAKESKIKKLDEYYCNQIAEDQKRFKNKQALDIKTEKRLYAPDPALKFPQTILLDQAREWLTAILK